MKTQTKVAIVAAIAAILVTAMQVFGPALINPNSADIKDKGRLSVS
jgi:hypothetical protein